MIRKLDERDAPGLARLLSENRVSLAPFEPARPDEFYSAAYQRQRIRDTENLYAILDENRIAGTIAVSNLVRGYFQSANIGYWVEQARNGRGLATRAVGSIIELAFTELELHRLEAATLVDNAASQRVLEKNGFTLIGLAPRYLCIAGAWRDHLVFQRTRDD